MGKTLTELDAELSQFILRQKLFFVATAPLAAGGRVNVSPKGLDTLRILGPSTVAYLDLVGSGVETIAHVRENSRVTLMFCAFEGKPRILRLYGQGRIVTPDDDRFAELRPKFADMAGARSIVVVECTTIAASCGFGVPQYTFVAERNELCDWANNQGEDRVRNYIAAKNTSSIDGLPGLRPKT